METEKTMQKNATIEKMKKGFNLVENFVNKAIYTDYFILGLLLIAFITWVTECAPFGFLTLGLLLSFMLIFARDILPLMGSLFGAALMLYTKDMDVLLPLWPILIPLGLALIFFFVRNIIFKVKNHEKFKFGKMFFPQLAVSVALLLGGVGVVSGEVYLGALGNALGLGIAGFAVYVIARNFISEDKSVDRPTYFAKFLAYIGVIIALELIVVMAKSDVEPARWAKVVWHVGWGNRNNISTYLLFTAPMCLYLSTKYRYGVVYLLLSALQYACLVLTFSRGGILFGFIALVFGVVFVILKAKNRKNQLIFLGSVLGVMLIGYLIMMNDVNDAIKSLLSRGTGLSGRDDLYAEAWELFKQHPFQGNGLGFEGYYGNFGDVVKMYWFHSTLFQVLACMGIIGILAYGYSYVIKGIVLCKNLRNTFNLFVIVVFIGFEGYSMMDTGTFIPGAYLLVVLILMCLVEMFTSTPEAIECDKLEMAEAKIQRENARKKRAKAQGEKEENLVADELADIDCTEESAQPNDCNMVVIDRDTDANQNPETSHEERIAEGNEQ